MKGCINMKLFDLVNLTKKDYDAYDSVFDAVVTICYIENEEDTYDKFCNEIIKKVDVIEQKAENTLIVNWTDMIARNEMKFRHFTERYWRKDAQYEDDSEEFIYNWIIEINNYMAGNVPEYYYGILLDLIDSLE